MMDQMQWSLIALPPSSVWPGGLQDASETLTLTTALSYSLLTCHTGRLSCCFHTEYLLTSPSSLLTSQFV